MADREDLFDARRCTCEPGDGRCVDGFCEDSQAAPRGLPPLDAEGVLWIAAVDLVPIGERIEWVQTLKARVEEVNAHRATYDGDPPGAGWRE